MQLFSELVKIPHEKLEKNGIFDCFLDKDSEFSINIQRLKESTTPEFSDSYNKIVKHFRNIGLLLSKAENKDAVAFRSAIKIFDFSEVNEIRLGYSKGKRGNGFGKKIKEKVIFDAYEIIKNGCEEPQLFELMGLFEKNVGADRISDMIGVIILEDIQKYTLKTLKKLKIDKKKKLEYDKGFIINPYTKKRIYLLPIEILHKLPIVQCWSDIAYAAEYNQSIKDEMNRIVGDTWNKLSKEKKKEKIRETILSNNEFISGIINAYKSESINQLNIKKDFSYNRRFILNLAEKYFKGKKTHI